MNKIIFTIIQYDLLSCVMFLNRIPRQPPPTGSVRKSLRNQKSHPCTTTTTTTSVCRTRTVLSVSQRKHQWTLRIRQRKNTTPLPQMTGNSWHRFWTGCFSSCCSPPMLCAPSASSFTAVRSNSCLASRKMCWTTFNLFKLLRS